MVIEAMVGIRSPDLEESKLGSGLLWNMNILISDVLFNTCILLLCVTSFWTGLEAYKCVTIVMFSWDLELVINFVGE